MSTTPAEPRREVGATLRCLFHSPAPRARRRAHLSTALFALTLALSTGLAGCSKDAGPPLESRPSATANVGGPSAVEIPPDLGRSFSHLLRRRATALLSGDRAMFARGLVMSDGAFTTEQAAYFTNLRHLPIAELRFDLDPGSLVRSGDDYWGVVAVSLQLDGYDARPVVTMDRYRFSPVGEGDSSFALSSVTDADWEERNKVLSQPWDDGPIEVRSGLGVLGIFDADSVSGSAGLLRSVERGISDVAGTVPYAWSRSVVVYALSDSDFMTSIEAPPGGGHPDRFDGLAFPVEVNPTSDEVASIRFVLHARTLSRPRPERDRLVRHELAHVAIGEHDDHAPAWLSEGLAEYVAVRPLAPQDRRISDAALAAARGRLITDLPEDATFNDADSALHYGVAWWACEYLATAFGQDSLWTVLDELDAAGVAGDPDDDSRLEKLIGINSRTLARKAAKQMLATFASEKPDIPGPSADPSVRRGPASDDPDAEGE